MTERATWTKFRRITIPMLSPALFYNLITGTIAALQLFTQQAFIPTEREDGWFVNWFIYNEAFNFGKMGYASAVGWLYAVLIIAHHPAGISLVVGVGLL